MIIDYNKKKYYPGTLFIGKERPDIVSAAPTDTIRVRFENSSKVLEVTRSALSKDVDIPAYPDGAWAVPAGSYREVTA